MTDNKIEFTNTQCRCGCGTVLTGKKSRFGQGHDARFVSNMRQLALSGEKGLHTLVTLVDKGSDPAIISQVSVQDAVEVLGSTALKDKLVNGFRKEQVRQAAREERIATIAANKEKAAKRRAEKAEKAAVETPTEETPAEEAPAGDLDITPAPAVEGEKPVTFQKRGRVRRGTTG